MRKPNFFIVGAAKCGTTAMFDFLGQHPDIFMSEMKEPHFLESDMRLPTDKRTMDWYLSLFRNASEEKRLGEASPSYLYSKTAANEIKKLNDNAYIIIMIRNPVDMLYSVYYQRLAAGYENIKDFGEAIYTRCDKAIRFRENVEKKLGLRLPVYLEVPKFAGQVRRFFDVFPRERIHVIVHDDFKKDNKGVYRNVLKFLDVDESFCPEFRVINDNKRFRSRTLKKMFRESPKIIVDMAKKSSYIVSLKHKIDDFNRVPFKRPEMAPALRQRLKEEYAPDVERLSELLGRDLTPWTKN